MTQANKFESTKEWDGKNDGSSPTPEKECSSSRHPNSSTDLQLAALINFVMMPWERNLRSRQPRMKKSMQTSKHSEVVLRIWSSKACGKPRYTGRVSGGKEHCPSASSHSFWLDLSGTLPSLRPFEHALQRSYGPLCKGSPSKTPDHRHIRWAALHQAVEAITCHLRTFSRDTGD